MINVPTLTIPNGATESNILDGHKVRWMKSIQIHPPAVLSGVVTVHTSSKSERDNKGNPAHDFQPLASEGIPIVLTGGENLIINQLPFGSMRLETTIAPGADENYPVDGQDDPGF